MDLFDNVTSFFKYTNMVYLQGWGEPLLNNDIFEMIRVCKDRGKLTGFTTNGMLLTEDTIRKLVDLDLDIIGISLAGTTAPTHNRIRRGTDFSKVISHLETLDKIKAEKKTRLPSVHLSYLMLRSNFHELKDILTLAKRVGAKQIVASNLTLIIDPELSSEAIFNDIVRIDYYRDTLDEIRYEAANENIIFDYHGPGLDDDSLCCRENVRHACVINVEGEVVPCVFNDPVLCENRELGDDKPRHYIFKDQSFQLRSMSFGNISNESLMRIWNKKEYTKFREHFKPKITRSLEQILSEMPQCCVKCYKRLGV